MSTLYRAVWRTADTTDVATSIGEARLRVSQWALNDPHALPLPDGESEVGRRQIHTSTVEGPDLQGFAIVVVDTSGEPAKSQDQWTTEVRVVADQDGVHTWVENRIQTDNPAKRLAVGRPRLVDDLLRLPGSPRLGRSAVVSSVVSMTGSDVDGLVTFLRDPQRSLPIIVFTDGPLTGGRAEGWSERVAQRVTGVATVVRLDESAVTMLRAELGDLAVWGGGVRIYVPAPLEDESDGWRHRFVPVRSMLQAEHAAINRVVYNVTQLSARRRVPPVFDAFATGVHGPRSEDTDRLVEELEYRLELEFEERNGLERELARAIGHLDRIKKELSARGLDALNWETQHEDPGSDDPPEEVQDTTEAVAAGQLHLHDFVEIPESAPQELDGVDSAPNAYAWGNTTWRGLRALAAYAAARQDGFEGDFWQWCKRGEALSWPATTKKLAMTESETVRSNSRFAQARTFKVSTAVDASGSVVMWAHLKISEGGGDLAPRVYFHDDTAGATRKVHVGFVGPHHLVPNTKS